MIRRLPVRLRAFSHALLRSALGTAALALLAPGLLSVVHAGPRPASSPSVSLSVPSEALLGSDVSFTVTFDNADPADEGYGPILDVILDTTGADDGAAGGPNDGLGTTSISASYLGIPFSASGSAQNMWIRTFDALGQATHPLIRNSSGAFITVTGTPGDTLVVLRLPFGSFSPSQPPATVEMTVNMSDLADVGTPLSIQARGGYQFGYTPLDDWCCGDAPDGTLSGFVSQSVTPVLFTLSKSYSGPEDEAASGPNFLGFYPLQYTLTVEIAPGQTLTGLTLTDALPANLQFVSLISSTPGGAACTTPGTTPGGALNCTFPGAVSGTVSLTFDFYVPRDDAGGSRVIDPASGDDVTSCDQASASGSWAPLDPRDVGGPVSASPAGCEHTLTDKSIAIQKSVANLSGGSHSAGDLLEYTLTFQVSDFFAFDGVTVTDVLSDGQHVDGSFTPTLALEGNGFSLGAAPFAGANFDVSCNYSGGPGAECTLDDPAANDGQTTLVFRASQELISRGLANGRLLGGCINPAGGSASPECNTGLPGGYDDGPTYATIRFRARVLDNFTDDFPSGDPSVDQGDVLGDDVSVVGNVLNTASFAPTGSSEADASAAGISIAAGSLTKEVYAVNGSTSLPDPVVVRPGDEVTFRIRYTMPVSDEENLELTDYLPLPVFHVNDPDDDGAAGPAWSFDPTVDATAPAPGVAKFGPADTFYNYTCSSAGPPPTGTPAGCLAPTVTSDVANNMLRFAYGDFSDTRHQGTTVDLLFTVTVSDDPFADGLLLTNEAHAFEGSTNAGNVSSDAIRQIVLSEPVLLSDKAVIWSDNPAAQFSPAATGPVTFIDPSNSPRWSGTINSTNLAAAPIDSNVTNVDAGDLLTFAIVIENTGSSLSGAFDLVIRDDLPAQYQIPAGGLNLQVYYGNGTGPISFTGLGGGPDGLPNTPDDLFGGGIELIDPVGQGVCQAHDPNTGNNIILITFDLQVSTAASPGQTITNTESLVGYAGAEGGPNHLAEPQTDTATATIAAPSVTKTMLSTNQAHTTGTNVAIGEQLQYQAVIRVPEGTSTSVTLVDSLDAGLAFVSLDSLTASSAALSTSVAGGFPQVLSNATISAIGTGLSNQGRRVTFNFGTVTNSDTDNATAETLTLTYTVVVINGGSNDRGDLRNNAAAWAWTSGTASGSAPNVRIVEPTLQVTKTALPTSGDAGDEVTFTLTIQHTAASNADAFDVTLSDAIPTGMVYVPGSLDCTTGAQDPDAGTCLESGGTISAEWTTLLDNGTSSVITFRAALQPSVVPGEVVTNTADVAWTSLPGDVTSPQSTHNTLSTERTGDIANPGGADNDYRASGSAGVTVTLPEPVKSIVATSEAHTGTVGGIERLAIGEIVRYRMSVALPEGTSPNFQLVDTLPQGLLLIDAGLARVSWTADNDLTEPADLAGADNDAVPPTFALPSGRVAAAMVGSQQQVTFSLGDLVNNDSDAGAETVTLEFNALVDNSSAGSNDAGEDRNNSFTVFISGSANGTSSSVAARISEPSITDLDKVILSPAPSDAGDMVSYRVSYSNPATADAATAFDVRLLDTLPTDLTLNLGSISVTLGGGAAGVTDASAGNSVDVTVAVVPAGGTVQVDFTAVVAAGVDAGQSIANTAGLTYTSLPGPSGTPSNATGSSTPGASGAANGERDGSGGINDYSDSDLISFTIAAPEASKAVTSTSDPGTGATQHDPSLSDLTIGETASFTITLTLPEGNTPALLTDDLPTANGVLAVVSSQVISIGANLSGSALSVGDPGVASDVNLADGFDDRVVFDFGTVANAPDGVVSDADRIRAQIVARLVNVAANQDADALVNTASINYGLGTATATATVEAVEPALDVAKQADDDAPALGQTVTYTLTISHLGSSTADAHDVRITDVVPGGLTYQPGSAVLPSGWSLDDSGAPTLIFSGSSLALTGGPVSLSYQVVVSPSSGPGDVFSNTASMTWTSLPGSVAEERTGAGGVDDYADSASESVTVTSVDLTLAKSDGGTSTSPGGIVAYTLSFGNIGNAMATGVVVSETVPANATFNQAGSTAGWSCADGAPAGTACTITTPDLGSGAGVVPAGGSGSVVFAVAVVSPLPSGVTDLSNSAAIADDGASGPEPTGNNSAGDTTPILAAPDLTLVKDDGRDVIAAGAALSYTLTVRNAGNQDATGVEVSDTVPANVAFDPSGSTSGWSCAPDTGPGSSCTLAVGDLGAGGIVVLTFQLIVDDPLPGGVTSIDNMATASDDGANGAEPTPGDNSDTDTDRIIAAPTDLAKSLAGTSQAHTAGSTAAIGEILTYEVALTVPPGTMQAVSLTDTVEQGLAFVDCVSIVGSPDVTTNLAGGFASACNPPTNPTVLEEPPGDAQAINQGRRAVFSLGDLTNSGATDGTLTIRYTAVVLNAASIVRGASAGNGLALVWNGGALSASGTSVDVVEPTLALSKAASPGVAPPGTAVTFTLALSHAAASDSDAFDLALEDVVPVGLTYVPGSLAWTGVGLAPTSLDDSASPALVVRWDAFPLGSVSEVEFQATVGGLAPGTVVENTALLEWTSLPDDGVSAPFSLSPFNELSTERSYDPGDAANLYGVEASATVTVPSLPATGFAPGRTTDLPDAASSAELADLGDLWLEIRGLGVEVPIVGVPAEEDGWDVTWLWGQAGHLAGTAFPGRPGNSALTGHVYLPDGRPGPFVNLGNLIWGDEITVRAGDLRYVYQVRQVWRVAPDDLSPLRPERLSWLTLLTCQGYDEANDSYRWRLVVRAVLVRVD